MSQFDQEKALEISQSISAIFDNSDASLAEVCSAVSLALRVRLDNEPDKMLRALYLMTMVKHLTMDKPGQELSRPAIEILRPN